MQYVYHNNHCTAFCFFSPPFFFLNLCATIKRLQEHAGYNLLLSGSLIRNSTRTQCRENHANDFIFKPKGYFLLFAFIRHEWITSPSSLLLRILRVFKSLETLTKNLSVCSCTLTPTCLSAPVSVTLQSLSIPIELCRLASFSTSFYCYHLTLCTSPFYHKHAVSQTWSLWFTLLRQVSFVCGDELPASINSLVFFLCFLGTFPCSTHTNWKKPLVKIRIVATFCDTTWLRKWNWFRTPPPHSLFLHW